MLAFFAIVAESVAEFAKVASVDGALDFLV